MPTPALHDWNLTFAEASTLQRELASRVSLASEGRPFKVVAGADISYNRFSPRMFASVVVWRIADGELLEAADAVGDATFPYVPGFLSFREAPLLLEAFAKLKHQPDAVLTDGQGLAHPRRFGVACHLGLWLNVPTAGCAKSRLIGEHAPLGMEAGDMAELIDKGERIGTVVRTKRRCNPIFVSPGHRMSHEEAVALTLACVRGYRVPEPTRQAHLRVNELRSNDAGNVKEATSE